MSRSIFNLFRKKGPKHGPGYPYIPTDTKDYDSVRRAGSTSRVCHAPFGSLRFSQPGNVLACCYNRDYVLGNIETDSLHEIWFGERAGRLRDKISHNDLTAGCDRCAADIAAKNFYNSGAINYDYLSDYGSSTYPVMLDFEISNTCNLECVMCNGEYSSTIRKQRERMPEYRQVYGASFVEQLQEFIPHLKEARFVGGEPFLVDIYYSIWDAIAAKAPGAKISVLTNGTVYNNRVKNLLQKADFEISFSIDSLNPENYARIRKRGNLAQVLEHFEAILDLQKQGGKHTSVNMCFMRQNWMDIPDMLRFCNGRDVSLIFHTVQYPFHTSLWNESREELERILAFFEEQEFEPPQTANSHQNTERFRTLSVQLRRWISQADDIARKRTEWQHKDTEELKRLFLQKMETSYTQTPHLDPSGMHTLAEKINRVYASVSPEQALKNALVELMFMPSALLVGEFMHVSVERMVQKLRFAHSLTPDAFIRTVES